MTKIILSGSSGQMGGTLTQVISERNDCTIVAGISKNFSSTSNFPTFNSPNEINVDADVIIDFSNPALLNSLLNFAIHKKMPIVICTTGFTDEQITKIKDASKLIPIFFSGNTSIGINLLIELAKKAALVLGSNFDIEIIEKHHNKKIDAPSGTALMIANAINSVNNQNLSYVYERHSKREPRSNKEIGIHSIRGGTIVGEHDVIFAGKDEVLTLSHTAQSKGIFAVGAINAAIFLLSKSAGLYNMSDLLK
ncbi:dihydrodipicolinate reductase [Clostridium sp. CAG:557]|jgi:4-hydroxy-tetrahydrodipicolinate reductase|nr:dihydrodipicolinate reductase [Clostridium sp. CAG:557]